MISRRKRKAVIPSWIPADQILHLSPAVTKRIIRDFDPRGIFLNIPYSQRYSKLEIAILSTVTAYDLMPRMARERSKLEMRLLKIVELMLSCAYGLTDVSYAKRMNMPLELGLLLAFGKESFVTSSRPYGALRTVSDLNFADIHYHRGTVSGLVKELSRWIEQTCSPKRITTRTLLRRYRRLQAIRKELGPDFEKLLPLEIGRLLEVAQDEFQMRLSTK